MDNVRIKNHPGDLPRGGRTILQEYRLIFETDGELNHADKIDIVLTIYFIVRRSEIPPLITQFISKSGKYTDIHKKAGGKSPAVPKISHKDNYARAAFPFIGVPY
jgi:hypothetical protein